MSEAIITEVVKSEEMTLSNIVWRVLGRQPKGFVEIILDYNQNLAMNGIFVPVGTVLKIPLHLLEDDVTDDKVIRLWD